MTVRREKDALLIDLEGSKRELFDYNKIEYSGYGIPHIAHRNNYKRRYKYNIFSQSLTKTHLEKIYSLMLLYKHWGEKIYITSQAYTILKPYEKGAKDRMYWTINLIGKRS